MTCLLLNKSLYHSDNSCELNTRSVLLISQVFQSCGGFFFYLEGFVLYHDYSCFYTILLLFMHWKSWVFRDLDP